MMYPPEKGNRNKLQRIFLASTPFNLAIAEYFKKRDNFVLQNYIDSLVDQYIIESGVTPEELIQQIEEKYQEYITSLLLDDGVN